MRRCPDLPIPGVGCSGIRCQPWEHSGVWPPRPGPAAFPGLFIIRVAQGWDWGFIFFFSVVVSNQRKKGTGAVSRTSCLWLRYLCREFAFPLGSGGSGGIRSSGPQRVLSQEPGMSSQWERQGRVIHRRKPSPETRDLELGCALGASCRVLVAPFPAIPIYPHGPARGEGKCCWMSEKAPPERENFLQFLPH